MSESYKLENKDKHDKGSKELYSNCCVVDHRQERDQGRETSKDRGKRKTFGVVRVSPESWRIPSYSLPHKRAIHLPHVNTPTTHYLFFKIRVRVPTISVIP